jgi:hypothetical protein
MRYSPLLLLATWMAIGCATDPSSSVEDAPLVDPTGSWDITLTWTAGTCGLTGVFAAALTVERSVTGYVLDDPGVHGTVVCSRDLCRVSFTETGPGPVGSSVTGVSMAADLAVDDADVITGTGGVTYQFENAATCSQQFGAVGRLR